MGKTKTVFINDKIIDDSVMEEPVKKISLKKPKRDEDSLVAKLNAELGIKEETAKSESAEAVGEAPLSEEVGDSEDTGVEQTHNEDQKTTKESEKTGPSGASRPDEQSTTKAKKVQKPGKAKPRSKKYQEVVKDLDRDEVYSLAEAVDMVKKLSYAKFDGTLEVHINTAAFGLRGLVSLPFAAGKKLRILAFGSPASKPDSEVVFGDDSTIEELLTGKMNFDIIITTPEWMPKLAKVARVLGPKGLMPNPKNGTITSDLKKAIDSFQSGQTEYKTESKAPVIHLGLGKLTQPTEELSANIKTLLQTIGKSRIKKVTLSPTMGPSVKLDISKVI